jgi:hypothetical protein
MNEMKKVVKVVGSNWNGDGMETLGYFSNIPTAKRILKTRFLKDNDWRIREMNSLSFTKIKIDQK